MLGRTHSARTVCASLLSLSCAAPGPGLGRGSRLLLGCSFFALSGLSVLMGVGAAFWLPVALAVLLLTGPGFPAGGSTASLAAVPEEEEESREVRLLILLLLLLLLLLILC